MKNIYIILLTSLILFSCSSNNNAEDLVIDDNSPCIVENLSVEYLTNTTARFSWVTNFNAKLYQIEYGKLGFKLGNGIEKSTSDEFLNIENLEPETSYSFYVRVYCDETQKYSNWSNSYTFITYKNNPLCDSIEEFKVRDVNNKLVIGFDYIIFDYKTNSSNYKHSRGIEIEYGIKGFTLGTGKVYIDENLIKYGDYGLAKIDNLIPNTEYDFYIRENCSKNGYSDRIKPLTVKTLNGGSNPNCLKPTNLTKFSYGINSNGDYYYPFSWNKANGVSIWDVGYVLTGKSIDNPLGIISVTKNNISLVGFTSGVKYDLYVRANCNTNGYSDWSGPLSFTAK